MLLIVDCRKPVISYFI